MKLKSYSELSRLRSFDERFEYLKLGGGIGVETFGFDRYLNQRFYQSREWQTVRNEVIIRDNGCDLGIEGYDIFENPHVHHMNPMGVNDIIHDSEYILDPEYLVLTSLKTHNAIHFGSDQDLYPKIVTSRKSGDTRLW
jgi:hypothetical protein